MPSAGSAVFERRHQERFLLYGTERSDLQNWLFAQIVYIRNEDTAIHSQSLAENLINLVGIMMDGKTALAYNDGRIVVSICSLDDLLHVRRKNGMLTYYLIINKTAGTIGRDVAVDKVLYLPEIIDNQLRATRRNIHLYPLLLGLLQSIYRALRNPVGFETHQSAINIEEQSLHLFILFLIHISYNNFPFIIIMLYI